MKTPKLYPKKDGAYYFTFQGKRHYGGKTLEKAEAKLREVTGLAPSGDTDLVALVGQYLDSLVGSQSPDTIYGKAGTYKRLLAYLSGQKIRAKLETFPATVRTLHSIADLSASTFCPIVREVSTFPRSSQRPRSLTFRFESRHPLG